MSRKNRDVDSDQLKSVQKRRTALKSILISGGVVSGANALPKSWSKPVIDSVLLPSHASTTADETDSGSDSQEEQPLSYFWMLSYNEGMLDERQERRTLFAERVLDTVIPTAHAVDVRPVKVIYICLSILGGAYSGKVAAMEYGTVAEYAVNGTVDSPKALPSPTVHCGTAPLHPTNMLVHSVDANSCECTFSVDGTEYSITVAQQDCQNFIPKCPS